MKKNGALKKATVVWDRTRYLVVFPNVFAATIQVVVHTIRQLITGSCGSEHVEIYNKLIVPRNPYNCFLGGTSHTAYSGRGHL